MEENEFLARFIKNNTEIDGKLFTPLTDVIDKFDNIEKLIVAHNNLLCSTHINRTIHKFKEYIYIKEYVNDTTFIIEKLQDSGLLGIDQYTNSVDFWLSNESYCIDDDVKKEAIRNMFANSHVALIYGAAGTGKSTLIKHVSNFWSSQNKIFLANTHPAVDNMKRKVIAGNSVFSTIAKFLSKNYNNVECDILFIDECSTVSNSDMRRILQKAKFNLLVLLGDIYQIESIYFGNWFSIATKFLPNTSIYKLDKPFRTSSKELLTIMGSCTQFR